MTRHGLKYAGLVCHGGAELFRHKAAGQRCGAGAHRGIPGDPGVREGQLPHGDRGLPKDVELIRLYPEIQALYVSWDGPALEVMKALTELERTDIAIATGDLDYASPCTWPGGRW